MTCGCRLFPATNNGKIIPMANKKTLLIGSALTVCAALGILWLSSTPATSPADIEAAIEAQNETPLTETAVVPASNSDDPQTVAPVSPTPAHVDVVSETVETTPWLSAPITPLSNELYDFIEAEEVSYISTTDYPFDEHKQTQLRALIKQGSMIMFDNTNPDYLDSYGVSETEVVSEYFGTASEGDVIIATGVTREDGSIHYLVLPLRNTDDADTSQLIADTKLAVTLLKEQKTDLASANRSE